MKITGQNEIAAKPEIVWGALNDPEILRQAIPGCESLDKISDTQFEATVITKVGPVKATFKGEVELSDLNPPHGYTLTGKGSGGSAGNAKGVAKVSLTPAGNGHTLLEYDVDAHVTGKLAQLGSRLISGTTKILAGKFFTSLQQIIGGDDEGRTPIKESSPITRWILVGGSVLVVLVLILVWALSRTG